MTCPVTDTPLFTYEFNGIDYRIDTSQHTAKELEKIKCFTCHNIMNTPVIICAEHHLCCLSCSTQLEGEYCPLCRNEKKLTEFKVDKHTDRNIKSLNVICSNDGCNYSHEISEIESHMKQCQHESVVCPGKCGAPPMKKQKMNDHKLKCFKHFKCECGERLPNNTSKEYFEIFKKHVCLNIAKHPATGYALTCLDCQKSEVFRFAETLCAPSFYEDGVYTSILDNNVHFILFDLPENEDNEITKMIKFNGTGKSERGYEVIKKCLIRVTRSQLVPKKLSFDLPWAQGLDKVTCIVYSGKEPIQKAMGTILYQEKRNALEPRSMISVRDVQPYSENKYLIRIITL